MVFKTKTIKNGNSGSYFTYVLKILNGTKEKLEKITIIRSGRVDIKRNSRTVKYF